MNSSSWRYSGLDRSTRGIVSTGGGRVTAAAELEETSAEVGTAGDGTEPVVS